MVNQTVEQKVRHKINLDIFWFKDKLLTDLENFLEPEELTGDVIETGEQL